MNDHILLRKVQLPEDFEALLTLWNNVGPGIGIGKSDELPELIKKFHADPELFLVAELEGNIIGTVIGGFDGRRGMVYHLAVTKEHQHQGLGEFLLKEVEDRLRAKGCVKAYLLVKKGNPTLETFYLQRDWQMMDHIKMFGKNLL